MKWVQYTNYKGDKAWVNLALISDASLENGGLYLYAPGAVDPQVIVRDPVDMKRISDILDKLCEE